MYLLTFAATPSMSANDWSLGRLRLPDERYDRNAGESSCRSGDDVPRSALIFHATYLSVLQHG